MAGPWEKYQTKDQGPWSKYKTAPAAEPAVTQQPQAQGTVAEQFTPQELAALQSAPQRQDVYAPETIPMPEAERIAAERAAAEQTGAAIADVPKSLGAGIVRGATTVLDMPGMAIGLAGKGVEAGMSAIGAPELGAATRESMISSPMGGGEAAKQAAETLTGGYSEFKGETVPGKIAGTVGEFLGSGAKPSVALTAGTASELAGMATKGTDFEPYARVIAALMAPGATGAMRKIITPFGGVSKERLALAKVLDDYGIPITAGQRTGSEALRRIEGRSAIASANGEKQAEEFTRAALSTIGENASKATPEVLDNAAKRIGSVFDDVLSGVDILPDRNTVTNMSESLQTYRQLTPSANVPPILNNINREMVKAFRSGNPIPAKTMKVWRSTLSKLTKSADTATRDAAIAALDVVDDATANALRAAGRTDAIEKLATARGQYRNLLAVEVAASRAGERTAQGIISPSQLRNAVVQQGRSAFVRGRRGDIAELSRAAEGVMKPLPTVESGGLRSIRGVPEMMGAGVGSSLGPLGAIAGVAAPTMARELAATPPLQRYFANQLLGQGQTGRNVLSTIPGTLANR